MSFPRAPFDETVPTHPLLVIDYELLRARDETELDRLWDAATKLGCACSCIPEHTNAQTCWPVFYLKSHGVELEPMFQLGSEFFDLPCAYACSYRVIPSDTGPVEEKMRYEQGNTGRTAGYKKAGANATNAKGDRDLVEFFNIPSADTRHFDSASYPDFVQGRLAIAQHFQVQADAVCRTIMNAMEQRLDLPSGSFDRLHDIENGDNSELRVIKGAPQRDLPPERLFQSQHTDFGSITLLSNRGIGGLQVCPPGSSEFLYIRPLDGHVVCNLGDAMTIFSGGILRSNIHRVVPPPGARA